ncbi:MAG: 30S ribosomal protein S4 [Desulfovibrionaceae bacterium]
MAKYTEAKCRQCRREGVKLYLKGERCYTEKCSYERRPYAPGQHGRNRKKISDYGLQLREKQKVRRIYGVLEKQFYLCFLEADRNKGVTGTVLLQTLECRFDNIIYRVGLANSRNQARQFITHGFFLINGRRVNIPSIQLSVGDTITVLEKYRENVVIMESQGVIARRGLPTWLDFNVENLTAVVKVLPQREDIQAPIDEHLIVEYYSR